MSRDPVVIDPPGFDQAAAWKECGAYVDKCGGLAREDGSVNWRAAFGADPGCVSCPACGQTYWAWGRRQRCADCGFEYPTDWWPMYSWGVQAVAGRDKEWFSPRLHQKRLAHPYYHYGFEHPVADPWEERGRIDWRAVMAKES